MLAKLGSHGYDVLIRVNRFVNWILQMMGKEKMSLSKRVMNSVNKAIIKVNNFEQTAAEIAIDKKYDYVICGHIHEPQIREVVTDKGKVTYLNSGDWVEHLTALEYAHGNWKLYHYDEKEYAQAPIINMDKKLPDLNVVIDEVKMFCPIPKSYANILLSV